MMESSMDELINTEVLVLGTGIAGATAALRLARAGIQVTMVSRAVLASETNTDWAQGGIIYRGKEESPEKLAEDIFRAGAGLSYPKAVNILAHEGPNIVEKFLIGQLGVQFDQEADGSLALALEGGHSVPRIAHATDATGHAIQTALLEAIAEQSKIQVLTAHTAIDLITPGHHARNRLSVYEPQSCAGAYLLDQQSGVVRRALAARTILATGGLGQIFLHTSNQPGARGDGLAMAYRAGARVINAEFIQFHPTTFYQTNAPRFLISEAVRGDGARLVHADGKPFMQKYDPQWKDLAPRDVVARSIHHEMLTKGTPNVYLDLYSNISKDRIENHFPHILATCLEYGIDPRQELVPVAPAAHYFCGGVWADAWGQTTIERLYAIGEVSCTGLHGANRLASTSLLEGVVWGWRSADHVINHLAGDPPNQPENIPPWEQAGSRLPDPALIAQDLSVIQHIMWNYVGLVRTTDRLDRALRELRQLETEIERFYRISKVTDELIGLRNAVRSSVIVAAAAWEDKTSSGCHYRE
jgi:L-aspartate oxidase